VNTTAGKSTKKTAKKSAKVAKKAACWLKAPQLRLLSGQINVRYGRDGMGTDPAAGAPSLPGRQLTPPQVGLL
jgi:hypothetical protein